MSLSQDVAEKVAFAAYRAQLRGARRDELDEKLVPEAVRDAWKGDRKFTNSQLRGFLTYCCRKEIPDWTDLIRHAMEKKRNPWQDNGAAATGFIDALRRWNDEGRLGEDSHAQDWLKQRWDEGRRGLSVGVDTAVEFPASEERLRIAREVLDRVIRKALREKGDGQ